MMLDVEKQRAAANRDSPILNSQLSILNYLKAFSLNPLPLKAKSFM